jgi:hypothetical protein
MLHATWCSAGHEPLMEYFAGTISDIITVINLLFYILKKTAAIPHLQTFVMKWTCYWTNQKSYEYFMPYEPMKYKCYGIIFYVQ